MTSLYNTHKKTQAQNNIEAHLFDAINAKTSEIPLNLKEFSLYRTRENSFRILQAFNEIASRHIKSHLFGTFERLIKLCDNNTLSCYYSQDTLASLFAGRNEVDSLSKRQLQNRLYDLEKRGWIIITSQGFQKTNVYTINLDKLNEHPEVLKKYKLLPAQTSGKCGSRADQPVYTPDNTTITQSIRIQSTKEKDEVLRSINTYKKTNTSFLNCDSKAEKEEVPIKMHSDWIPKWQTHKNLVKCLGVTDEFIEDETVAFRKSVMNPEKAISKEEKSNDEWNRIFYGHCKQSLTHYSKFGSRNIKFSKRLNYYETHEKRVTKECKKEIPYDHSKRTLLKGEPAEWGSIEWQQWYYSWCYNIGRRLTTGDWIKMGLPPLTY